MSKKKKSSTRTKSGIKAGTLNFEIPRETINQKKMDRTDTCIRGFNDMIEGGIPRGTINLLAGNVGTGRTMFALQFLCKGAEIHSEPGVYISLEKEPLDIIAMAESLNLNPKKLIAEKKLSIIKPDMHRFETLKQSIVDEVDRLHAKRLVIKPFSLLTAYFNNIYDVRKALSELRREMNALDCTAIAVSDITEGSHSFSSTGYEEFVPNSVILLDLEIKKDSSSFSRSIFVRKMERTKHSLKRVPFEITNSGIEVYPDAEVF